MKIKQLIITTTLLVSFATFAQKDELKTLKKLYGKDVVAGQDFANYTDAVSKLEAVATDENDKAAAAFYKTMIPVLKINALGKTPSSAQIANAITPKNISDLASGINATLDFEKKSAKKVFTDKINETIASLRQPLLGYVDYLSKENKVGDSANVLNSIYLLTKDQDMLYYAASYATNAKDYSTALQYYYELKKLNYSGESSIYYAKSIISGEEQAFSTKEERDKMILFKTHNSPRDEKNPSKKSEIYKNIALILVQLERKDEAKAALADARKENPDNLDLLVNEANLYLELKEYDKYTSLVNEALMKNPNDAQMVFNLGVLSGQANKLEDAEKYYKRAIEINPNYSEAYTNLAELLLRGDKVLVDEMNKLGTSDKDNKRYDVLTANRKSLFNKVLPILEKAYQIKSDDEFVKGTLISVYKFLEMNDKAKALKNK